MKLRHRVLTLACLAASLTTAPLGAAELVTASPNSVEGSTTKGPYYEHSENELRARKLARGFANVTLAVAEIPNQAFQEAYRTSPVSGAIIGAGKGVVMGVKRFAIGLWEMATFYAPINNYKPYIEPEVVFMEHEH